MPHRSATLRTLALAAPRPPAGRIRAAAALLALGVSLAAAPRPVAHPHDGPKSEMVLGVEREVLAARDAIRAAIDAKDVAALKARYSPDFTHTHGSGKVDGRDARIVALLANEPVIERASVSDLHVHVPAPTTAIVTGRSPIRSTSDGKTYEFRWMQVYVSAGAGWVLAASQATRMASPPVN